MAGIDPDFAFYLLSITNASSIIGRLGGGILADRYGKLLSAHIRDFGSFPYPTHEQVPLIS